MPEFLIAPTERPPLTDLGTVSSLPERVGVDVLWQSPNGLAGVQRKQVMDLIASVRDGRLVKELIQMRSLSFRAVVIEGQMNFASDGRFMSQHTQWTKRQQEGVELAIFREEAMVLHTLSSLDTCKTVEHLYEWTKKTEHVSSLLAHPGAKKNGWGNYDSRETAIHTISTWPMFSVELAGRVFDHYGHVPCRHDVVLDSPVNIDGIGKRRAQAMMKVLGVTGGKDDG